MIIDKRFGSLPCPMQLALPKSTQFVLPGKGREGLREMSSLGHPLARTCWFERGQPTLLPQAVVAQQDSSAHSCDLNKNHTPRLQRMYIATTTRESNHTSWSTILGGPNKNRTVPSFFPSRATSCPLYKALGSDPASG